MKAHHLVAVALVLFGIPFSAGATTNFVGCYAPTQESIIQDSDADFRMEVRVSRNGRLETVSISGDTPWPLRTATPEELKSVPSRGGRAVEGLSMDPTEDQRKEWKEGDPPLMGLPVITRVVSDAGETGFAVPLLAMLLTKVPCRRERAGKNLAGPHARAHEAVSAAAKATFVGCYVPTKESLRSFEKFGMKVRVTRDGRLEAVKVRVTRDGRQEAVFAEDSGPPWPLQTATPEELKTIGSRGVRAIEGLSTPPAEWQRKEWKEGDPPLMGMQIIARLVGDAGETAFAAPFLGLLLKKVPCRRERSSGAGR
jgi:hypothetical protein